MGTLINVAAILIGGGIGILFGARLPEQLKRTVISGMGLFVLAIGIQMFLKTGNALIVLGALLIWLFAYKLMLLPPALWEGWRYRLLPALTLVIALGACFAVGQHALRERAKSLVDADFTASFE